MLREFGVAGLHAAKLPKARIRAGFFRWIRRDSDGRDRPQGLGFTGLDG